MNVQTKDMNQCEDIQYFILNNSMNYNLSNTDFQLLLEDFCNVTDVSSPVLEITFITAITMTTLYGILLVSGTAGNVFTCAVIARNRYMHTATNCYLFSLAISDLLLLVTGIPHEIHTLWRPQPPYTLGEAVCVFRGFTAEASAYASVLTITSFTVERYLAICHPLKAHAMLGPSRAIKCAILLWLVAAACAMPVALQFGIMYQVDQEGEIMPQSSVCTLKTRETHTFLISSVVFFCLPLLMIFVLYIKIGLKLRKPTILGNNRENSVSSSERKDVRQHNNRKGIIKMLVAVVVCFFLCWSPFHAQRLMAIYVETPTPFLDTVFHLLHQASGISYYLSATLDPILYHLMSRRFRKAFSDTFCCNRSSNSAGTMARTMDCSTSKAYKTTVLSLQVVKD